MLAFLLWGSWAYYVNQQHSDGDSASAVVSGLTQGIGSFCITLFMVKSVCWLYQRLPATPLRMVLPAMITVSLTGTLLLTAHLIVGTADIAGTLIPALTVALCFNLFTTFRIRQSAPVPQASNDSR